jgi:hypothetical protein
MKSVLDALKITRDQYLRWMIARKIHSVGKIFLLGHMRCASSLLTHILATSPDIFGYGETHIYYSSSEDFQNLALDICKTQKRWFIREKWILDKILHNDHLCNFTLLQQPDVRCIFMIREPFSSIASISRLRGWELEKSSTYYVRRLEFLSEISAYLPHQSSFLITHQNLFSRTKDSLTSLQKYLELDNALKEDYEILPSTGKQGVGDTSDKIKAGKILKSGNDVDSGGVNLTDKDKFFLEDEYRKCMEVLMQNCILVGSSEEL